VLARMNDAPARAAQLLCQHRLQRRRLGPLPQHCIPHDQASAYATQNELHALLIQAGLGAVVGHKIGCTTPVMQQFLGIDSPCAGGVLAATVHHRGARLRCADFLRVGVECEIAVLLGADLPPAQAPFTGKSVSAAVAACAVGMEIVDDRYEDYKTIGTPTLIADDFFDAGCVLGEFVHDWRKLDIPMLPGRTLINGVEVGRGRAEQVMGHPFEALAWLANSLASRGQYLKSGEFVLTGSVVETRWVAAGDIAVVAIEGLGEARAAFSA
jgi:2-keto-4-pentenoate hydratase